MGHREVGSLAQILWPAGTKSGFYPTSLAAQALHRRSLVSEHTAYGVSEFMGQGLYRVCEETSYLLQKAQRKLTSQAWHYVDVLPLC